MDYETYLKLPRVLQSERLINYFSRAEIIVDEKEPDSGYLVIYVPFYYGTAKYELNKITQTLEANSTETKPEGS